MPQHPNRRSFLGGLLFISLSPLATGELPHSKTAAPNRQTLKEIKPLGNDYFSINGWVVKKETLIRGAS